MAQALLVYDVPDDRLRTKIADVCMDYGLKRIQYSTFMGPMTRNRQEEVFQKIRRLAGKREVNVQLFSICDRDIPLRMQLIVRDGGPAASLTLPAPVMSMALPDVVESEKDRDDG